MVGLLCSLPTVSLLSNTLAFLLIELGFVQEVNGEPLISERAGPSLSPSSELRLVETSDGILFTND